MLTASGVLLVRERAQQLTRPITSAIEHVFTTSQRVLVDRIDLLRLEAREDLLTAARGTALTGGAAILFFYGWIVALAWVVYLLWGSIPLGTALGAVTAFHVMGGAVLGWVGVRTLKGIRVLRPDDPEAERRERQALSAGMRGAT
jgi:Putative Actinobacterial Holin-X, holin superfamily III